MSFYAFPLYYKLHGHGLFRYCIVAELFYIVFVRFAGASYDGLSTYVGYSESKYRLRISLAHPRDCHFAHVQ